MHLGLDFKKKPQRIILAIIFFEEFLELSQDSVNSNELTCRNESPFLAPALVDVMLLAITDIVLEMVFVITLSSYSPEKATHSLLVKAIMDLIVAEVCSGWIALLVMTSKEFRTRMENPR